jgi:hypothetical protein
LPVHQIRIGNLTDLPVRRRRCESVMTAAPPMLNAVATASHRLTGIVQTLRKHCLLTGDIACQHRSFAVDTNRKPRQLADVSLTCHLHDACMIAWREQRGSRPKTRQSSSTAKCRTRRSRERFKHNNYKTRVSRAPYAKTALSNQRGFLGSAEATILCGVHSISTHNVTARP